MCGSRHGSGHVLRMPEPKRVSQLMRDNLLNITVILIAAGRIRVEGNMTLNNLGKVYAVEQSFLVRIPIDASERDDRGTTGRLGKDMIAVAKHHGITVAVRKAGLG